jgi:hypothetical protein
MFQGFVIANRFSAVKHKRNDKGELKKKNYSIMIWVEHLKGFRLSISTDFFQYFKTAVKEKPV